MNASLRKLYTEKAAITAADMLNGRVLSFYAGHGIAVKCVLTDRESEFSGKDEKRTCQNHLVLEESDRSTTKASSAETIGNGERFHRIINDEFCNLAFRENCAERSRNCRLASTTA